MSSTDADAGFPVFPCAAAGCPAWTTAVRTYLIGTLAAFWMFERLAGL